MIIDFHTHIFPTDVLINRELYIDDPGFKLLYSSKKSVIVDQIGLSDYISANELYGAAAMSFPWIDEKRCMRHNEYMASISGDNTFPFGIIPISGNRSVRAYTEDIKKQGLSGIGEIAFYSHGMNNIAMKFLHEVLEASSEFSLPVCIHLNEPVGHQYPGKYEPSLFQVYELIKDVPAVVVILSHWGGGLFFYELMPEVRENLKNVFYDTAAAPYIYSDSIYEAALKIVKPEKIIFGSDYPLLGVNRYKNSIEEKIESTDDRKKIFIENAKRILKI